MEKTWIALITGPDCYVEGGKTFEKFEITQEDIDFFFEERDLLEIPTISGAIEYYKEEYSAEWEQKFCKVQWLTVSEFNELFNEAERFIR